MTLYTYPLIDIQGPTGPTGPTGALGYTGSQGSGYTGSASTVEGPTGATGADGVVGYRGSQGDTGYTGSLGFTGSAGADGVVGYRGSQGDLGFTGSRGVIGYTGSSGTIGYVGSVGLRGFTGYTGSKGDLGFTGSAGQDGFVGSQGLRGFTGFTGYTGSVGFTGSRGEGGTGYTGSQGAGSTGYTGSKGDLGFTGSKGDSGEFGAVGYVGSRGDQGFTGSQGNQGVGYVGSRGADAAGYTGSVGYTGSAGTSGTTGFTGSVGAGDTGYVGSRGEVGFTGSRGDLGTVGYTGSQGLLGATGYVGSRGEDAAVGYRGSQGDTGYTGSIGAVGFTGSIGFTGSVGYTGSRGSTGYTGSVGFTGSEGVRGQKGDVGYTGSLGVGTVGYTGSRGVIGYTGSQGPSGTGGFSAIPSSTAVAPGFPLAVDANTGLFGNTDDQIGISTNSTARLLVTNTQTQVTNDLAGTTALFTSGTSQVSINANVGSGTTNGLVLNSDGNLEIIRSAGGAYIDFKNISTEDYDFRIAQQGTNNTIEFFSGPAPGTSAATLNNTLLYLTGTLNSSDVFVRAQGGSEGGQLSLERAPSGSTLSGNMLVDTISNRLRVFDGGGSFRGAFLNIDTTAADVGSEIIHSGNYSSYALPLTGGTLSGTVTATSFIVNTNQAYYLKSDQTVSLKWDGTNISFNQNVSTIGAMTSAGGYFTATNVDAEGAVFTNTLRDNSFNRDTGLDLGAGLLVFKVDGTQAGYFNTSGDLNISGSYQGSDSRLKKDVTTISNALDKVKNLRGVNYTRISNNQKLLGVIAQELQAVIPELVMADRDGMLSVAYGNLVGLIIEAIKELDTKVQLLMNKAPTA